MQCPVVKKGAGETVKEENLARLQSFTPTKGAAWHSLLLLLFVIHYPVSLPSVAGRSFASQRLNGVG
ncbi:MAG TPA: hypothetical protein VG738_00480 [Chitinophagaceae bacterium]|nr:hypothetical protein [Chitinophagaceae bacterium]